MSRLVPLVAVVLAAAFAGGGAATTGSGLYGTVTRGPTKPVCQVGVPCSAPAPGVTLVFTRASGGAAVRTITRANGSYRVALAPGTYAVRTMQKYFGRVPKPSSVTVRSARWTRVDFSIDTGIR